VPSRNFKYPCYTVGEHLLELRQLCQLFVLCLAVISVLYPTVIDGYVGTDPGTEASTPADISLCLQKQPNCEPHARMSVYQVRFHALTKNGTR
jgi:hypothetical protein